MPDHPGKKPDEVEEENYFFKFSSFESKLLDLYNNNPDFVVPSTRLNEIKAFVERGLEDFSISRLKSKMPWGVPVPGDDEHVMYVWFDALVNYISAIGWPDEKYMEWWPVIQFAGKDNLRQQSAMWQAMLMSVNIEPSKQIVIHGFITSEGRKMSKTVGNVLDPFDFINEYGTDALRYYFLRHIHPFEDSDLTEEKFKEAYNANLVNGLGNLVSRIMTMAVNYGVILPKDYKTQMVINNNSPLNSYKFNLYMDSIWSDIQELDEFIQEEQPFKKIKTDEIGAKKDLEYLLGRLQDIAVELNPVMPETSEKILKIIKENKKPEALFPRKD